MKKVILFAAALIGLTSCGSESPLEASLRNDVETRRSTEHNLGYKLSKIEFLDTITVEDRLQALNDCSQLNSVCEAVSQKSFKTIRDAEFLYRRSDPQYEEKIMTGELKDASPWCTELRIQTERADSILNHWDSIDKSSWDFAYVIYWYSQRDKQFSNNYPGDWLESQMESIMQLRPIYEEYLAIKNAPKDSVIYYAVNHVYSVNNPIFKKRVELTDSVTITKDNIVVDRVDKTDFISLLESVTK